MSYNCTTAKLVLAIENKWGKLEEEFEGEGVVFWAGEEHNCWTDLDGIMLFWIQIVTRV